MDLQVNSSTLLPLLALAVSLVTGSSEPSNMEPAVFPGSVGESQAAVEATGEARCSKPPFCIKWWLADHTSWGALGSILLVIYVVSLVLLVLFIVGVSLVLLGRGCYSCCGDEEDDAHGDQLLAPHQRTRLSNYPGYPRQYPPGYQPVEQRDLDPDMNGHGAGKEHSQENAAGAMGRLRIWCGALCVFCCGAMVSGILVGSGAVIWWKASGSPPMAGFARSNITFDGHETITHSSGHHVEKKDTE